MQKIGILTAGGDAPGMNRCLWQIALEAHRCKDQLVGFQGGFYGIFKQLFQELTPSLLLPYARRGGTFLGTIRYPELIPQIDLLVELLQQNQIQKLIILGGNGSLRAAKTISEKGIVTAFIPATIDNDIAVSEMSIGFDTALNTGLEALDRLRDTAESMPRFFAFETLGGNTGFIALELGRLACADAILIPEEPLEPAILSAKIQEALQTKKEALVVASEGYPDLNRVLQDCSQKTDTRLRLTSIGHTQRGGNPSAWDRKLAQDMGLIAYQSLAQDQSGAIVHSQGKVQYTPYSSQLDKRMTTSSLQVVL